MHLLHFFFFHFPRFQGNELELMEVKLPLKAYLSSIMAAGKIYICIFFLFYVFTLHMDICIRSTSVFVL